MITFAENKTMEILLVILSQFLFSFCRLLNVRYTAKERIIPTLITSFFVKASWLVSSAIGVKSVLEFDYIVIIAYVLSGLIGEWISFKIKIKN